MFEDKTATFNRNLMGRIEDNLRFVKSFLSLSTTLAACKTDLPSDTIIPDDLHPFAMEALVKLKEIENVFFYGKLEKPLDK